MFLGSMPSALQSLRIQLLGFVFKVSSLLLSGLRQRNVCLLHFAMKLLLSTVKEETLTSVRKLKLLCFAEYIWKFFQDQFGLAAFHTTYTFGFEHRFQHAEHRPRWPKNRFVCFSIIYGANAFFTDKGYGTVAAFTIVGWIKGSGQHWLT